MQLHRDIRDASSDEAQITEYNEYEGQDVKGVLSRKQIKKQRCFIFTGFSDAKGRAVKVVMKLSCTSSLF